MNVHSVIIGNKTLFQGPEGDLALITQRQSGECEVRMCDADRLILVDEIYPVRSEAVSRVATWLGVK